jgi:hypothetical protein
MPVLQWSLAARRAVAVEVAGKALIIIAVIPRIGGSQRSPLPQGFRTQLLALGPVNKISTNLTSALLKQLLQDEEDFGELETKGFQ